MKVPAFAEEVVRTLKGWNHEAYLVGGCVRDSLMGREPKDWDVATSARPEIVNECFHRVIKTGEKHGTVTVMIGKEPVEVTTFREDGEYTDGRRPDTVKFGVSLKEDLARRDFTMNAIAYDPITKEYHDPFDGLLDIRQGLIGCVGEPIHRFQEDALRVVRALRFSCQLGFDIKPATSAAMLALRPERLKNVSAERRGQELLKAIIGKFADPQLANLFETYFELFKSWGVITDQDEQLDLFELGQVDPIPKLRLAHMYDCWQPEKVRDVLATLRLPSAVSNGVRDLVSAMKGTKGPLPWTADIRLLLSNAKQKNVDILELTSLIQSRGYDVLACRTREVIGTNPPLTFGDLAITGDEIAGLVGGKGPQVGKTLRHLLHIVLDDPSKNNKETLIREVNTRGVL
jgi:tRNA nucleotidyltransferase (CCA-adding enzyme)